MASLLSHGLSWLRMAGAGDRRLALPVLQTFSAVASVAKLASFFDLARTLAGFYLSTKPPKLLREEAPEKMADRRRVELGSRNIL